MAVLSDYTSGTITVTQGSADFTGTDTLWRTMRFREGDMVLLQGYTMVIKGADETGLPIASNTSGQFTDLWPGTSGTFQYRMRYTSDGARVSGQSAELIELLGNGVLDNIAEIPVEDGKLLVGNAAGQYEPISKDDLGTPDPNGSLGKLAALTLEPNKLLKTNSSSNIVLIDDKFSKTLSTVAVSTPVAYVDVTLPAGYEYFDLVLNYLIPATNAVALGMQFSTDNGATFFTGNDYRSSAISVTAASTGAFGGAMIATNLVVSNDISNIHGVSTRISIHPGSSAGRPAMSAVTGVQASFGYKVQIYTGSLLTVFQRVTTIRVFFSSGNISSGRVTLIGAVNG